MQGGNNPLPPAREPGQQQRHGIAQKGKAGLAEIGAERSSRRCQQAEAAQPGPQQFPAEAEGGPASDAVVIGQRQQTAIPAPLSQAPAHDLRGLLLTGKSPGIGVAEKHRPAINCCLGCHPKGGNRSQGRLKPPMDLPNRSRSLNRSLSLLCCIQRGSSESKAGLTAILRGCRGESRIGTMPLTRNIRGGEERRFYTKVAKGAKADKLSRYLQSGNGVGRAQHICAPTFRLSPFASSECSVGTPSARSASSAFNPICFFNRE